MVTSSRPSPDQYAERDQVTLAHIRDYQLGLYAAISALFHGSKSSGHVVRSLAAKNLVEIHERAIPGGVSFATLTARGMAAVGMTDKPKATHLSPVALDFAIALLWWCVLDGGHRRYRIRGEQLGEIFPGGGVAKNVPHVVTDEFGEPAILRAYHATNARVGTIRQNVEKFFEKGSVSAQTAAWIAAGDYGLLVLVPTRDKVRQLESSLASSVAASGRRLVIGLGPTASTLAPMLRSQRRGGKDG